MGREDKVGEVNRSWGQAVRDAEESIGERCSPKFRERPRFMITEKYGFNDRTTIRRMEGRTVHRFLRDETLTGTANVIGSNRIRADGP